MAFFGAAIAEKSLDLRGGGVRARQGVLPLAFLSAVPFLILAIAIIAKGGADVNTLSVFDPGKTLPWNELTRYATGSPLSAAAFAQEFQGK